MSHEAVCRMLSNENAKEKIKAHIILQRAPFLKGLKVSCIINVNPGECKILNDIIKDTDIHFVRLICVNERCLVFLYRKDTLLEYLRRSDIRNFLSGYGYECDSLEKVLARLKNQVNISGRKGHEFPHEIGAFLNYPIEDVKGYIKDHGKNSLRTKYWQVYHGLKGATQTFESYDMAKEKAVSEYLAGKAFREIANQGA